MVGFLNSKARRNFVLDYDLSPFFAFVNYESSCISEDTPSPIWTLFLEFQSTHLIKTLKKEVTPPENNYLLPETKTLLKYLKFHPWDKIEDDQWSYFLVSVILPILSSYGHFSKDTKPLVKEIVTMTCHFVAKDSTKSEHFLKSLAKLGDESVKLGNYVEKKIKEQKLKLRLAEQNEVCETIKAEVAEKERRIKTQNSRTAGQTFPESKEVESHISEKVGFLIFLH